MAVGRAAFQTAADINSTVGGICSELEALMHRIQNIQVFMVATDLKTAPYTMASGDEAIIKGAMTCADAIRIQHDAQANLTFIKQCVGIPNS